jgi:hypothetical protein
MRTARIYQLISVLLSHGYQRVSKMSASVEQSSTDVSIQSLTMYFELHSTSDNPTLYQLLRLHPIPAMTLRPPKFTPEAQRLNSAKG